MKAEDIRITSGVVESIEAQGNVYIYGGVVERLTAKGDCHQYGGIVEQRIQMIGQDQLKQEPKVVYKDRVVYRDRIVYRDKIVYRVNPRQERTISQQQAEIAKLRNELLNKEEEKPTDDVLVRRIISLQNELEAEKAAHRKEVEELQYRLDGALEVNAKLRMGIKDTDHRSEEIADKHIDILATLMSLYPFTPDGDLEMEFGLPRNKIKYVAQVLGGVKSKEARQEAVEYLAKQDRELIQRRGGAQINHFSRPVEQVAKNGRVINTFISITEAEETTGCDQSTVRSHCQRYNNRKLRVYTKQGFTFRYKV